MEQIVAIFTLVYQFGDFVVKAIVAYIATDTGEQEWGDVLSAWTHVGIFHPEDVLTHEEAANLSQVFPEQGSAVGGGDNPQEEQQAERPAPRRVIPSPFKKNQAEG